MDRTSVIASIRQALRQRSGYKYSVTGGHGTAYGWINVAAAPKDRCDQAGNEMRMAQLAGMLGLERVHFQGYSIPASYDYYREAIARARFGEPLGFIGKRYWD